MNVGPVGPPSYEAAIVVIRVDSSMLARTRMPNQADWVPGCVAVRVSGALGRKNRRWNDDMMMRMMLETYRSNDAAITTAMIRVMLTAIVIHELV